MERDTEILVGHQILQDLGKTDKTNISYDTKVSDFDNQFEVAIQDRQRVVYTASYGRSQNRYRADARFRCR